MEKRQNKSIDDSANQELLIEYSGTRRMVEDAINSVKLQKKSADEESYQRIKRLIKKYGIPKEVYVDIPKSVSKNQPLKE